MPPPIKKKYSKEHMMILIMIYYLKGILSFHDIQEVLDPITKKYFGSEESFNLEAIYKEAFNIEDIQKDAVKEDISENIKRAMTMFTDAPEEDRDFFTMFALVVQLGFDVYVKRLLIEKLIDSYTAKNQQTVPSKSKKKEPKTE